MSHVEKSHSFLVATWRLPEFLTFPATFQVFQPLPGKPFFPSFPTKIISGDLLAGIYSLGPHLQALAFKKPLSFR